MPPKKKPKEKAASQSRSLTERKWNSDNSIKHLPTQQSLEVIDLNKTYIIKEETATTSTTHTSVYAAKKPPQGGALSKIKRQSVTLQSQEDEPDAPPMRGISLEGRSLEKGTENDGREIQKKKSRKLSDPLKGSVPPKPRNSRSNSFAVEGLQRRPSIERGGTNMIDMEVSGIGSPRRSGEGGSGPQTPSLSQATKESIAQKRQKQLEEKQPGFESHSATYPSSKPPIPPQPADLTVSAPVRHVRNKHKHRSSSKAESGFTPGGDETPRGRHYSRNNSLAELDSSITGGSLNGSQLEELNPFDNPEHGLREAMQNISSEDWSVKCEGLLAVRRLAMFHADTLLPQLHSVVMAVQEEVRG